MALRLKRKPGESIRIGDAVVTVDKVSKHGAYVYLNIDAPRDVPVRRTEAERDESKCN